jgi:hypothetical protein
METGGINSTKQPYETWKIALQSRRNMEVIDQYFDTEDLLASTNFQTQSSR